MRLEDAFDQSARIAIAKLGHDVPLLWQEEESGVLIYASCYEMLNGIIELNEVLEANDMATFEDFVSGIKYHYVDYPSDESYEEFSVSARWCFSCMDIALGSVVSIKKVTVQKSGDEIIFVFAFTHPYCESCLGRNERCDDLGW